MFIDILHRAHSVSFSFLCVIDTEILATVVHLLRSMTLSTSPAVLPAFVIAPIPRGSHAPDVCPFVFVFRKPSVFGHSGASFCPQVSKSIVLPHVLREVSRQCCGLQLSFGIILCCIFFFLSDPLLHMYHPFTKPTIVERMRTSTSPDVKERPMFRLDRNTELKLRLRMWETGQISDLQGPGQQNSGPLRRTARRVQLQTDEQRGKRACPLTARGSISKAMKGLVARAAQGSADCRRNWTTALIPWSSGTGTHPTAECAEGTNWHGAR